MWKDNRRARCLVERREALLAEQFALTRNSYSTENFVEQNYRRADRTEEPIVHRDGYCHLVENPTAELTALVKDLYQLQTVAQPMLVSNALGQAVQSALDVLGHCKLTLPIVSTVVWGIVLVDSDSPDSDVSFSDPQVPFSIFVSVPPRGSDAATLRLAESILHESMHLYLTLIEQENSLVRLASNSLMTYSPWRGCLRPITGVLHGAFVFRAIHDFFTQLRTVDLPPTERDHVCSRLLQINDDFRKLRLCTVRNGLTVFGTRLVDEIVSIPTIQSW